MSRNYEVLIKADEARRILPREAHLDGGYAERTMGLSTEPYWKEEAAKLVQAVFPLPSVPGPRAVVFAGVGDDGQGAICAMAATILAERGEGRVCAVDSNFRSPSLHHRFGVESLDGLAGGLTQAEPISDLARQIENSNLWLLSCGSDSTNGGILATADRLGARLCELRENFDYVLIHAAAANKYSDATTLARVADGLVLVVEADSTTCEVVERTMESFEVASIVLLGTVLNNRKFHIPQAIYRWLK